MADNEEYVETLECDVRSSLYHFYVYVLSFAPSKACAATSIRAIADSASPFSSGTHDGKACRPVGSQHLVRDRALGHQVRQVAEGSDDVGRSCT